MERILTELTLHSRYFVEVGGAKIDSFASVGFLMEKSSLDKPLVSHILLLKANERRVEIVYWAF